MLTKVICVSFKKMKTLQFFNPKNITDVSLGDIVIVETYRGIEHGTVKSEVKMVSSQEIVAYPLRDIIRKATPEDLEKVEDNKQKEVRACELALKKIEQHNLPMKLIDVEYLFDKKKIVFYFSADGRIDFRKLVKDLAATFKTRIELHQIGVRDEARMMGGLGHCGRSICCATFLSQFSPVSVKMAKEQGLSLNPVMISGLCGRLMCCLKYEYDVYRLIKANLPTVGSEVTLPEGKSIVIDVNVPKRSILVELPSTIKIEVSYDRVKELEREGKIVRAQETGNDYPDEEEENLENFS